MSLNEQQLIVRIELHLAPRPHSLQPSRSDITTTNSNNNNQSSRDASSSLTTTAAAENSINSLIQTPIEHAIFQKNKDDLNVKRSEALLKESHEFMKYLQKKYHLSTTQPADILGRQISRMKKCENKVKKSSSSSS